MKTENRISKIRNFFAFPHKYSPCVLGAIFARPPGHITKTQAFFCECVSKFLSCTVPIHAPANVWNSKLLRSAQLVGDAVLQMICH